MPVLPRYLKPLPRWLAWGLCCLLLQACSQFPTLFQDRPQQVRQLLSEQQFYPALDVIDRAPPSAPDREQLDQLRGQVLKAIADYEKHTLGEAGSLSSRGKWADALETLDQALQHVPASKKLLARRKQLQQTIDRETRKLDLSLAEVRAQSLPDEIPLLEKTLAYSGDDSTRQQLAQRRQQAEHAHRLLLAAAKRMVAHRQWSRARHYTNLAQHLHKDAATEALQRQIDAHIARGKFSRLQQALEEDNLLLARKLVADTDSRDRDDSFKALVATLNRKLSAEVTRLTQLGQQAYTRGNVSSAIDAWEKARQLQPENTELQKRLERARAFQRNYQRLKKE